MTALGRVSRMKDPCATAMRSVVRLFWPRVYLGGAVWVGLVVEEQRGDVGVFIVSGDVQRCQLVFAGRVHVDPPLQQQAHHLGVAVLGRDVQRTQTSLHTPHTPSHTLCVSPDLTLLK